MKHLKRVILVFAFYSSGLSAGIINVPADIDSIQGGIDLANNGDTVLVQPGIYIENINFNGKNIVVGSLTLTTGDTAYISQTVIDGSQPNHPDSGSVVYFISGEDSNSVLSGFKITGGTGTWIAGWGNTSQTNGGGIFLNNSSSPILANLIVRGNVGESANGAGIGCNSNSNPTIENVSVVANDGSGSADTNDGSAGILLADSSPILRNVKIVNNIGLMAGGLYCNGNSDPVLINVTIANNIASGSAWWNEVAELVCWGDADPVLINTIVWNDILSEILLREDGSITVAYSDIQNGLDSILTFNSDTTFWLDGNINSNPMFVDPVNGDYRLQTGSPCVDAGIQDTMIIYNNGQDTLIVPPIPYLGTAPDMGAYEFDPAVAIPTQPAEEIPNVFSLRQNYPNPFNPTTNIEFSIPKSEFVALKVYNILGEEVATLVSERLTAGSYKYDWDARDLASGVYLCRVQAGNYIEVKKMVLLR